MVFARTSKAEKPSQGISVFIVPRDAAGLSVAPKDRKMGQAGQEAGRRRASQSGTEYPDALMQQITGAIAGAPARRVLGSW